MLYEYNQAHNNAPTPYTIYNESTAPNAPSVNNEPFIYDAANPITSRDLPFRLDDASTHYATPSSDGEGDEDALMTSPPPSSPHPPVDKLSDTAPMAHAPNIEVEAGSTSKSGLYSLPIWLSGSGVIVPFTPITRGKLPVDPNVSSASLVSNFSYLSQAEGPTFSVKEYLEQLLRSDAQHGQRYLDAMGGMKSVLGNVLQKTRLYTAGSDFTIGDGWNKIVSAEDVINKAERAMDVFIKMEALYCEKHPGERIGELGP